MEVDNNGKEGKQTIMQKKNEIDNNEKQTNAKQIIKEEETHKKGKSTIMIKREIDSNEKKRKKKPIDSKAKKRIQ